MSEKLKVVHYLNQFYGGYGGEDTADMNVVVKEEVVGPGMLLKQKLGDDYEIVATIMCGDNYSSENLDSVSKEIVNITKKYDADIFIAGPGFNAGRYGMACGGFTAAVTEKLKIPAVTALYVENPGTDLFKNRCYILPTQNSGKNMRNAIKEVVSFVKKLVADEVVVGDSEEFFGIGPAVEIDYSIPASTRGIDMLLNKYYGKKIQTEVIMPNREEIPVPLLEKPLSEAKIAVVTDGGLVPKGNPDNQVPTNSTTYRKYDFGDVKSLDYEDYQVSHQGYNNEFILEDPNRLVPIDALVSLKEEGVIGDIHHMFYSTAGVMTGKDVCKEFGIGIAEELKNNNVDAVILTST